MESKNKTAFPDRLKYTKVTGSIFSEAFHKFLEDFIEKKWRFENISSKFIFFRLAFGLIPNIPEKKFETSAEPADIILR